MHLIHICKKTHKVTGLMYICKTEQDPFKYEGSGIEWRQHLREHGKEHDTEVLFSSEDRDEVRQFCLDYAKTNPEYWKKEEYANMLLESGGYDNTGQANPNFKHGRAVGWKSNKQIQKENDRIRNAKYYAENREKELARMRAYYHRTKGG
tara:strand:- start:73 stop:522 length:450 start_codon:yes stop_codon:yes gene_type:complete